MQEGGPVRHVAAGSHAPDEGALAGLAHAKVAGIQHPEAHLQDRQGSAPGTHPQGCCTSARTDECVLLRSGRMHGHMDIHRHIVCAATLL